MSVAWILGSLALVGIYAPSLASISRLWWTDTYAGHGMFVPLYSALIAWMDRSRYAAVSHRSDPKGLLVILLALGLLALGKWMDSLVLQALSLVVAVAGLVLWGFGARCLRLAAFPVAFLVFVLPLPRVVVDALSLDLRTFAAEFAGAVLWLANIPSYQQGLIIELRTTTIEVVPACDGLRFLMALLTLTAAFAEVSQRSLGRKLVLVTLAIPIAILANAIRVTTIVVASHYVGPQAASGVIHHMIGKSVWALALAFLAAVALILTRTGRSAQPRPAEPLVPPGNPERVAPSL